MILGIDLSSKELMISLISSSVSFAGRYASKICFWRVNSSTFSSLFAFLNARISSYNYLISFFTLLIKQFAKRII